MRTQSASGAAFDAAAQRHTLAALERSLAEDLHFLAAWESGLAPWPGAFLRVRQIRRAHPALAARVLSDCISPHVPSATGSAAWPSAPGTVAAHEL